MNFFKIFYRYKKHRSKHYKIYTHSQAKLKKHLCLYTVTPHCPQGMVTACPWIPKSSNVQVPYIKWDNGNAQMSYISTTEKHKEKILIIIRGK